MLVSDDPMNCPIGSLEVKSIVPASLPGNEIINRLRLEVDFPGRPGWAGGITVEIELRR